MLRPHLEDGVPLTRAAAAEDVPPRTARRWLARYRADGLAGLARPERSDKGRRCQPADLVALVQGLALRRPAPSIAHIHRETLRLAGDQGWAPPSYSTVQSIIAALDPGLVALAHDGAAAYRDRYELVYRREADKPNEVWRQIPGRSLTTITI